MSDMEMSKEDLDWIDSNFEQLTNSAKEILAEFNAAADSSDEAFNE